MTYHVVLSSSARKYLKKLKHSGTFNPVSLREVLRILENGDSFPDKFKDHQLHGDLARYRECHLGFNLLLQYEKDDVLELITISKIGTHPELFGE